MILRISQKVNRYHPPQVGGPYLRSQPSLSSRILSTISARTEAERQQHKKKKELQEQSKRQIFEEQVEGT